MHFVAVLSSYSVRSKQRATDGAGAIKRLQRYSNPATSSAYQHPVPHRLVDLLVRLPLEPREGHAVAVRGPGRGGDRVDALVGRVTRAQHQAVGVHATARRGGGGCL